MGRSLSKSTMSSLLMGVLILMPGTSAIAQNVMTVLVLRGKPDGNGTVAPAPLADGTRVESTRPWTEIVFSNGSSIAFETDSDFTLQETSRAGGNAQAVIRGSASHG